MGRNFGRCGEFCAGIRSGGDIGRFPLNDTIQEVIAQFKKNHCARIDAVGRNVRLVNFISKSVKSRKWKNRPV
jgi:hypothetical protein